MNDIRQLFSDRALRQLGFNVNTKPKNNEYAKLRRRLKEYPIVSWFNGTQPIYKVPYTFIEEFMNCPDFISGGRSVSKFRDMYLHRISVLPNGARRRSYYKMVTEFDDKMIDKSILKEN